jgi:transcriptional regulator with XRE-family HTH domain
MQWLEHERELRGLSLREVARTMGYVNASRVGDYLRMRIVPGPEIVRRLAIAIGVAPIEALWLGGHNGAVFEYFLNLYRLGWAWQREDRVHLDPHHGASFFLEHWAPDAPDDLSGVPPKYAHRYHEAAIYNLAGRFRTVALPKPSALAFLLAIGLFVRRGDFLRPGTRELVRELSLIASELLPRAERADVPRQVDYKEPFKRAERILPLRFPDRGTHLALVSEYVQSWCDVVCIGYANYARVALYDQGGFVGQPEHNEYWIENLWEWQVVDPVIADEFRLKPLTEPN